MKFISIILPCYNEERYIEACIESVLSSDYSKENIELLVIDGGSTDNTVNIINRYASKYYFIRVFHNPEKIVPISMNIGVKEAKGDYIIRIDAHAKYDTNYFSRLIEWHSKLNADNVGGIGNTDTLSQCSKALSIKEILAHKFGVGNSLFRTGTNKVLEVDTVPFGCYPRDIFERFGYYNEKLVRNQDIELNKRIKKKGGKIYLVPDVNCIYFARETWSMLAKNNFQNGLWNILTLYYTHSISSISFRHLVPMLFVLSLFVPLVISIIIPKVIIISFFVLIIYFISLFIISLGLSVNKKIPIFYLITSFVVLHVSYGSGSIYGILKALKLKLKNE